MAVTITNQKWYQGIANAIRARNGTNAQYLPSQLAAAVQALTVYGTLANPGSPSYGAAEGAVTTDDSYYAAIAAAIRAKNGSAARYTPAQMAPAILAFDTAAPTSLIRVYIPAGKRNFSYLALLDGGTSGSALANFHSGHVSGGYVLIQVGSTGTYGLRLNYGTIETRTVTVTALGGTYNVSF